MNLSEISHKASTTKTSVEKKESIWNKDISLTGNKISDKEKSYIYHQLFNLIDSGIDIRYAFEILENQIKSKKTKEKIAEIHEAVVKGKSLSHAMEDSKYFSNYEFYSVRIGEETGKLNNVLQQLNQFYEDKLSQRRQLTSALSYPILILFASVGAVAFMMFFIIPMFEEVFARFGNKLPWITQVIIDASSFLNQYLWLIALIIASLVALNFYFSKNPTLKTFKERMILAIPVFGEIYRSIFLARFCTSMALLVSSDVPIINALEMVKNMINFRNLEIPIAHIKEQIIGGKSLHQTMSKYKIFDHEMIALVKVGEEVNKLGEFFDKLSNTYTEAVKHKTGLMGTVVEPVMIIFLGLIVGIILIAMYLPMFELSSNVGLG